MSYLCNVKIVIFTNNVMNFYTKENIVIDALNKCYGTNETKRNAYFDAKRDIVKMKKVTDTCEE